MAIERRGTTGSMRSEAIRSVIRAYDDPIVRAYCWGRFGILRQRFLDEIGQYLPARGRVLDVGCGFGLFSLYYASAQPGAHRRGLRPQCAPHRDGPARPRGGSASPTSATRSATSRTSGRRRALRRRVHARHRPPHPAGRGAAAARAAAPRRCPRAARLLVKDVDTPAGLQALVHPRARQGDGPAHAGALLGRGRARRRCWRTWASTCTGTSWWTSCRIPHVLYVGRRRADRRGEPDPAARRALTAGYGKMRHPPRRHARRARRARW